MSFDWLGDYDHDPPTWKAVFYRLLRATLVLIGYLATLVVFTLLTFALIGMQT